MTTEIKLRLKYRTGGSSKKTYDGQRGNALAYELGRNHGWARAAGRKGELIKAGTTDYWRGVSDGTELYQGGFFADGERRAVRRP